MGNLGSCLTAAHTTDRNGQPHGPEFSGLRGTVQPFVRDPIAMSADFDEHDDFDPFNPKNFVDKDPPSEPPSEPSAANGKADHLPEESEPPPQAYDDAIAVPESPPESPVEYSSDSEWSARAFISSAATEEFIRVLNQCREQITEAGDEGISPAGRQEMIEDLDKIATQNGRRVVDEQLYQDAIREIGRAGERADKLAKLKAAINTSKQMMRAGEFTCQSAVDFINQKVEEYDTRLILGDEETDKIVAEHAAYAKRHDEIELAALKAAIESAKQSIRAGGIVLTDAVAHIQEMMEMRNIRAIVGDDEVNRMLAEVADFARQAEEARERDQAAKQTTKNKLLLSTAPTPYVARDPREIPRRIWLYGRHYVRDFVSATIAASNVGKTTQAIAESVAMATGNNFMSADEDKTLEPLRVWYWNGEDPRDELERRITAVCQLHKIDRDELAADGRLFYDSGHDAPLNFATSTGPGKTQFDDQTITWFVAKIKELKIDIVIIDPFISCHSIGENDNTAIDKVVKRLGQIAVECHCAIGILHHVRKMLRGQGEITSDDARGATAIVNACRSSRALNRMTPAEAGAAGLKGDKAHRSYFRVDRDRGNMAPADAATWAHLVDVHLANGDHVAALERFDYPKPFDNVTTADMEAVRAEARRANQAGNPYMLAPQAKERWIGAAVAERLERLELDLGNRGHCARISKLVKTWIQNGVLKIEEGTDPKTRQPKRKMVIPGDWNEGPTTADQAAKNTDDKLPEEALAWVDSDACPPAYRAGFKTVYGRMRFLRKWTMRGLFSVPDGLAARIGEGDIAVAERDGSLSIQTASGKLEGASPPGPDGWYPWEPTDNGDADDDENGDELEE
jgi:hypothetical protein